MSVPIQGPNPNAHIGTQHKADTSHDSSKLLETVVDDMATVLGGQKQAQQASLGREAAMQKMQQQTQQTGKQAEEAAMAKAMAALLGEEDEKVAKKRKKRSFSKRIEEFRAIRASLEGVKFDDPEEQAELERFISNFDRVSRSYKRLQETDEKLKQATERAKLAKKEKKKKVKK